MDFTIFFRPGWIFARHANSGDLQVITARSLVVATLNQGKLRELRELLAGWPFQLYSLTDFPNIDPVPETGGSFIENASLKAVGYATQTGCLTLADDSGLEVDALGGAPGVLSARYAGESASDAERIEKLLLELSSNPVMKRSARFVSAVVIADGGGRAAKKFRSHLPGDSKAVGAVQGVLRGPFQQRMTEHRKKICTGAESILF